MSNKFENNFLKPKALPLWSCLLLCLFLQKSLFTNPTGLIDNFALGISRSETPEQLKAERDEYSEEPFFILQQSGNIIFQVLASGNIEWTGTLNQNSTTTMGNLLPVSDGIQLGSTESSWGKLYLNEMYFPLFELEANALSSERVDLTLSQLEAVQHKKDPSNIQLKLKSGETVSVKNPNQRAFYNVSHIIPILIKRLQDDRTKIDQQTKNLDTFNQTQKNQELKIAELLKDLQQVQVSAEQKIQQQSNRIQALEHELKNLKEELKILTSTVQDKLKPLESEPPLQASDNLAP